MITRLIALALVSVMSFLGFQKSEYAPFLPLSLEQALIGTSTTSSTAAITTPKAKVAPSSKAISSNIKTLPIPVSSAIKKNATKITTTPNALSAATTTKATPKIIQTPTSTIPIKPAPVIVSPAPVSNPQNIPTQPAPSNLSVSQKIAAETVNIFCQARRGPYIESITGSGVEVDTSGIYLTNAHVGIYMMLADTQPAGTLSCFIRDGSPAHKVYDAHIVYLPSSWVYAHQNAYSLNAALTGTGEKDYALIERGNVVGTKGSEVAASFSEAPSQGQSVYLSGYPVFDGSTISTALYNLAAPSTILNTYALGGTQNALLDSAPTTLAKEGSSGGGAYDVNGNLIGIMDAAINTTPGELPSERIITTGYITNDLQNDTGQSLLSMIANASTERATFLQNTAPTLSSTLINNQ